MIGWIIFGILVLFLSIFIHKCTTDEYNNKLPFPIWLLMLFIVLSMIPFVNLGYFIGGAIFYSMGINDEHIKFQAKYAPKFIQKIIKFLNKEL